MQRGATISSSTKEAEEGDRLTLTVALKSAAKAKMVTLQRYQPSRYGWDAPAWNDVKTVNPRGNRRLRFAVLATEKNVERFRAVVAYKKAKPTTSRPVNIKVWRWIPLSEYDPYYETGGTTVYGTFGINGRVYKGFGPYTFSHLGSWESQFTPGRNCRAFRGVFGLDDDSDDGSSGVIAVTADDVQVYETPPLTPGMSLEWTVQLPHPYRLGLQLRDTSPGGSEAHDEVESYPAIGDPALLCTGV
ncbi:hypothetical protein [Nocardioides abyssi]|uniref:Uncharacterized protein n=1 Tax=Nocardioides abyssi TaxID=3058370 RepID=A0ABT8EPE5_9ACTN|nr:hypothetical protein [Nocardioides abyssi]MDN4159979.1 hypothetical protein [Nocardioides abyssi]